MHKLWIRWLVGFALVLAAMAVLGILASVRYGTGPLLDVLLVLSGMGASSTYVQLARPPLHTPLRRPRLPAIDKVIVWQNGMVMVFDSDGNQIPAYQGVWLEKRAAILRAFHGTIKYAVWGDITSLEE